MSELTAFERQQRELARELRRSPWWKNIKAKGRCYFCGGQFRPQEITMDHLTPIASGGQSVKNNIVPACKRCNTQKAATDPLDELFAQIEEKKGGD